MNQWIWIQDSTTKKIIEDASWTFWSSRSECARFLEGADTRALSLDREGPCQVDIVRKDARYNGIPIMLNSSVPQFPGILCKVLILLSCVLLY